MVAATTVAVGAIIATGGAATPVVVAAASEGVACGIAGAGAAIGGTVTTGAAVAGSSVAAGAAGAITGAVAGGTAGSAAVGAGIAATTAGGIAASGGGAATAASLGFLAGPVGWIVLGAEFNDANNEQSLTFDCWKPVLRDNTTQPSKGMLLRDVLSDPRIKNVDVSRSISTAYPQIQLENVWGDSFEIVYVRLPWNEIAAHAVPL